MAHDHPDWGLKVSAFDALVKEVLQSGCAEREAQSALGKERGQGRAHC